MINKPIGMSSFDVVRLVRKALKRRDIGHCGTLDPLASGVLVLAIGEATKLVDYVMGATKEYVFEITWGKTTDTGDMEGNVIEEKDYIPQLSEIRDALCSFMPSYLQIPPKYSAIKINGKRAYNLARKGENFDINAKNVSLLDAAILDHSFDTTVIKITCGKGFYVRSLTTDIARKLNASAYTSMIRRTAVGKFCIMHAICVAKDIELVYNAVTHSAVLPIAAALDDILVQQVSLEEATKLSHGVPIFGCLKSNIVCYKCIPVAVCVQDGDFIRPKRVFNLLKKECF